MTPAGEVFPDEIQLPVMKSNGVKLEIRYTGWTLIAVLSVLSALCGAFLWLFRLGETNAKAPPDTKR